MKKFLDFSHIKGDFLGGLTAGIVALPLALAFGVASGLGPAAGLYGAIFIAFFASLFGGTPTQISGPTAPMTMVSLTVISGIIAAYEGEVEKAMPAILTVFLIGGLLQILLGISGIGKYIKYIPYPVLSGFMTAIGVMIIITQLPVVLGYDVAKDSEFIDAFKPQAEEVILVNILKEEAAEDLLVLEDFEETIKRAADIEEKHIIQEATTLAKKEASGTIGALKILPRAFRQINWVEVVLALSTILLIYGVKRITKAIPSTLVALVIVSGIAFLASIEYIPIQEIPNELPKPNFMIFSQFNWTSIAPYIFSAITLALLGSIDSLLTSVVADNMTKTRHKPNQELIGQGIGNSISSIFGGLPGAGATIRTVVNINAGGVTKLSGMIAGLILFFILMALGPVASNIPNAVLAGILITVGIGVMDFKGLKAMPYLPKDIDLKFFKLSSEVLIMVIVLLLSTFWDLVNAVGIGLIISSLIFMKKMGDLTSEQSKVSNLKEVSWPDEADFPDNLKEEVFIKHVNGPLFFGSTSDFQQLSDQIPSEAQVVIIRMEKMTYIDQSGLYTLEDIILGLEQKGIQVLAVGIPMAPKQKMESLDIIPDLIAEEHIFETFEECLSWVKANVEDEV